MDRFDSSTVPCDEDALIDLVYQLENALVTRGILNSRVLPDQNSLDAELDPASAEESGNIVWVKVLPSIYCPN